METYCVQIRSGDGWISLMKTTEWPIAYNYCHDYEWHGEHLVIFHRPWDRVIVQNTQEVVIEKMPEGCSVLYRKDLADPSVEDDPWTDE